MDAINEPVVPVKKIKKRKFTMDANNEPEVPVKKIKKIEFTNLLLAYTYFLNESSTKYIGIGFNSETLLPNLIIRSSKKEICLSTLDWITFYTSLQEESTTDVDDQTRKNKKKLIVKKTQENEFVFRFDKEKISLTSDEWEKFKTFVNFFNSVMLYNHSAINVINFYINNYLEKCLQNNKKCLDVKEYFEPNMVGQVCLNYSRLFYEIPIYCKNKINNQLYFNINFNV